MISYSGKVAFVTGGASGIGLAIARTFLAADMKVAIVDIEQSALGALDKEFKTKAANVLVLKVDVTDQSAMEAAARQVEQHFGKIHVLVNNAGVGFAGTLDAVTHEDWDWVLDVNVKGIVNGLQACISRIKQHGEGGYIVNTSSMAGLMPFPGMGIYSASKCAVVGLSESLQADLSPHNIGVSVLCPGVVKTNIFKAGRNRPNADVSEVANITAADEQSMNFMAGALEASVVGDMVLHAMRTQEFYILTHPEIRPVVANRFKQIDQAFVRWQMYRDQQD